MPFRRDVRPVLEVNSHGHSSVAFVNNVFVGNLEIASPFFPHSLLLSCFSFPWFPDCNLGSRNKMNSIHCMCVQDVGTGPR